MCCFRHIENIKGEKSPVPEPILGILEIFDVLVESESSTKYFPLWEFLWTELKNVESYKFIKRPCINWIEFNERIV